MAILRRNMGSRGGSAPNPYVQREAKTLFLRVPFVDWTRVKIGEKVEFRTIARDNSRLTNADLPTPVVAYVYTGGAGLGDYDCKLMVLEGHRFEPVFAIAQDQEALKLEGFASYDEFRRYWRKRRKGQYHPMEKAHVWRVRAFAPGDPDELGRKLLLHLYGEYLDESSCQ